MKKRFLCMALAVITVFNGCSLKNSSFQRSDVELVIEENVTDTKVEEPIVVQEVQPVVKEIVISAIFLVVFLIFFLRMILLSQI